MPRVRPLTVRVLDLHLEHLDDPDHVCDHGEVKLWPGDTLAIGDGRKRGLGELRLEPDGTLTLTVVTEEYVLGRWIRDQLDSRAPTDCGGAGGDPGEILKREATYPAPTQRARIRTRPDAFAR